MSVLSRKLCASVLMVLSLGMHGAANAGPVTDIFGVLIETGPWAGEAGSLTLNYDDGDVMGVGEEFLESSLFDMVLEISGLVFGKTDDLDYPVAPLLGFVNGLLDSLDFVTLDPSVKVARLEGFPIIDGEYRMRSFAPAAVPVPGTALLALIGLTLVLHARRNRLPERRSAW